MEGIMIAIGQALGQWQVYVWSSLAMWLIVPFLKAVKKASK